MQIIYTTQASGFKEGVSYRNPRYFAGPESGARHVTVIGDWPDVLAAYKEVGVEVETIKSAVAKADGNGESIKPKKPTITELKVALEGLGVAIPEGVTKQADLQALLDEANSTGKDEQ